ncbi:hypothetical protein SAMN05661080_04307 [Modestobacter sp. DSM 44400]|uniref:hypothetical protein n=1 Tax=Modestobacter sp. DSM 44400 TaxID=1550230 RepID=UPI000898059F|nr:hypothetical protein [Modestobacter sp. DSM 44400]SDY69311.1 hypothetical protein SAMN05661080_04307 [Modestobacter sp. DSM 44400]
MNLEGRYTSLVADQVQDNGPHRQAGPLVPPQLTPVLRAVSIDVLPRLSLQVVSAGRQVGDLPAKHLAQLPDLGPGCQRGAWPGGMGSPGWDEARGDVRTPRLSLSNFCTADDT